nr:hypothetical protein [Henriciella pelagia]
MFLNFLSTISSRDNLVADFFSGYAVFDRSKVAFFRLVKFVELGPQLVDPGVLGHAEFVDVARILFAEDLQEFVGEQASSETANDGLFQIVLMNGQMIFAGLGVSA